MKLISKPDGVGGHVLVLCQRVKIFIEIGAHFEKLGEIPLHVKQAILRFCNFPAENDRRAQTGAEREFVGIRSPCAGKRQVETQAVGMRLVTDRLSVIIICPPHRRTAFERLEIKPPASAGAIIYYGFRHPLKYQIPETVKSFDVPYLANTLSSRFVIV